MSWRDDLQLGGKGSFRGIEFFVRQTSGRVGRRTVIHRYPGRNDPGVEDNGREPREFDLECFLLGDNYMYERDRLRQAFERRGPGDLIHPYWGKLRVVVNGHVRIQETPDEGGMARFAMSVTQVGKTISPIVAPDTAAGVEDAADEAVEALEEEFEEEFTVIGYIADVLQDAVDLVNGVISDLNKIKGYVNAAMAIADTIGDTIQTLADTVTSLILLPAQLVSSVQSIVNGIMASISTIGSAWDNYFGDDEDPDSVVGAPVGSPTSAAVISSDVRIDLAMRAWRELNTFGDDLSTVNETTPQRERQADNRVVMVNLVRTLALIEGCRALSAMPFTSSDKVDEVRIELLAAFDSLLDTVGDKAYAALMDLRVALVSHFAIVAEDLPSTITYTPNRTMPTLVLSQQLYGTPDREPEIIWRNGIRNPCLAPGGEALEVLVYD